MRRQLVESVQLSDLEHGSTAVSYVSGHLRGFRVTLNYKYELYYRLSLFNFNGQQGDNLNINRLANNSRAILRA